MPDKARTNTIVNPPNLFGIKRLNLCIRRMMNYIRHSVFDGNVPLYGAVALIANIVFDGKLNWLKPRNTKAVIDW